MYNLKAVYFLLQVGMLIIVPTKAIRIEKEVTLTSQEFSALQEFKRRISSTSVDPWLKRDLALIRWLRANRLDVSAAESAFKTNLNWRKENAIDSILNEDWSYFKQEYYFDDTGSDYEGRPVIAADISEWDVSHAVISGRGPQLLRYMIRGLESASQRVRKLQENGLNVTQWQVILNMDNFNLRTHGCLNCLPIYLQFITAHETYYPFGADKIIIINTPAAFEIVLRLVRPVMSQAMRDSLIVLGSNRAEWRNLVLSLVPSDQLARQFGGTKSSLY